MGAQIYLLTTPGGVPSPERSTGSGTDRKRHYNKVGGRIDRLPDPLAFVLIGFHWTVTSHTNR